MNTWSFPKGSQIDKQTEPFTFTHKEINKNNLENNLEEENPKENNNLSNKENKYYKDLNYEGQRTNELSSTNFKLLLKGEKEIKKENNVKINQVDNTQKNPNEGEIYIKNNNYIEVENENDDDNYYEDYYYFISEIIPPQNFSEKLKNIKKKYEKLKKEIEWLKKENKKYNPNFIAKKNKYYQ